MLEQILFQSTHPVWGGTHEFDVNATGETFQSTHPVWGGTCLRAESLRGQHDFNPPTPCGVGPTIEEQQAEIKHFNPPTPCGVGLRKIRTMRDKKGFQSTHPVWGGTNALRLVDNKSNISIHPPRVGWDAHTPA